MALDDKTLVQPRRPANARLWVVTFVAAAVVLLGYTANRIRTIPISTLLYGAQSTSERTALKYARYIADETPFLVLTGSSLMDRIEEGYLPSHSHNLAGGGDSPLTALEFLVRRQRLPRVVIVELNVMSRDVDHHLLDEFAGTSRPAVLLHYVRPLRNAAIANVMPVEAKWWDERAQLLLKQSPAHYDPAAKLALSSAMQAEIKKSSTLAVFARNAARLQELTAQLEARGVIVRYIEMPTADELRNNTYTKERQRILDPISRQRRIDAPPIDDLRQADGAHMDERSALLYARALATLTESILRNAIAP